VTPSKEKQILGRIDLGPTGPERRRHPRAPVDLRVGLGFSSASAFLTAHATDISRGGLFLAVLGGPNTPPFEAGQTIALRVSLGAEHTIETQARIVRVERSPAGGFAAGIAVEFTNLDEFSAQLIDATVEQQLAAAPTAPSEP
jgi:hypothetical protein